MQITLENTVVKDLKVESKSHSQQRNSKRGFKIDFDIVFPPNPPDNFIIRFKVQISNTKQFDIDLTYDCVFKTDDVIDSDFKDSQFPSVNAPAIAYPFLRSFISSLTLNCGYEIVMLPTINFTKFLAQPKELTENSML